MKCDSAPNNDVSIMLKQCGQILTHFNKITCKINVTLDVKEQCQWLSNGVQFRGLTSYVMTSVKCYI